MNCYVAYTRPRKEFLAHQELRELEIGAFLPTQTRSIVIRRKRTVISEALFTRYIFIETDLTDETYSAINACRGIEYLIANDGKPAIVPRQSIEILKMADKAGAFNFTKSKMKFTPGDNVEILQGPFTGLIAKVQSASPRKRVKVLMNLLGAQIPAEIDEEDLREAI